MATESLKSQAILDLEREHEHKFINEKFAKQAHRIVHGNAGWFLRLVPDSDDSQQTHGVSQDGN